VPAQKLAPRARAEIVVPPLNADEVELVLRV
jgi:hypothetical protein